MSKKMIKSNEWVIGSKYYVICGIWQANATFCGMHKFGNKIKAVFTFGTLETWNKSINIVSSKSNIKVYNTEARGL